MEIIEGTIQTRREGPTQEIWGLGTRKYGQDRQYGAQSKPNVVLGIIRPACGGYAIDHTETTYTYDDAVAMICARATMVAPW